MSHPIRPDAGWGDVARCPLPHVADLLPAIAALRDDTGETRHLGRR